MQNVLGIDGSVCRSVCRPSHYLKTNDGNISRSFHHRVAQRVLFLIP